MARTQHETMVRNITRAYRNATPADAAAGLGWYAEAYRVAADIWPERPDLAAGVIAALSPRCQWSTNVVWARAMVNAARSGAATPPAVHTTAMRGQAWRIANGEAPLSVLNGPKVRSFWANIMGDTDAVTCDVWAVFVALGRKDETMVRTQARYDLVASAYRRAAAIVGVSPRECQAAVWVAARGVKPTDAGFHAASAAGVAA